MAVAESIVASSLADSNLPAFDTRYATMCRSNYYCFEDDANIGDAEFGMTTVAGKSICTVPDSGLLNDNNNIYCPTTGRIDKGNSADVFDLAVQRPNKQYIASLDIAEPFRVLIRSINVGTLFSVYDENISSSDVNSPSVDVSKKKKDLSNNSNNNTIRSNRGRLSKDQRASLLSRTSFVEGRLLAFGEAITPPCRTVHSDLVYISNKIHNSSQTISSTSPNTTSGTHDNQKQHIFEEWLFFPIPIGQLPLDCVLELIVYGADTCHQSANHSPVDGNNSNNSGCSGRLSEVMLVPIGKCATYVFSSAGRLKIGPKRYEVRSIIDECNGREDSLCAKDAHSVLSSCTPRETLAPWEYMRNQYRCGRLEPVPWLDRLLNEEGIVEKMGRDLRQDPLQRVKECYYFSDLFVDSKRTDQGYREERVDARYQCDEHGSEEKMDENKTMFNEENKINIQHTSTSRSSRCASPTRSDTCISTASGNKANHRYRYHQVPSQKSMKLRNILPISQDIVGAAQDLADYLELDYDKYYSDISNNNNKKIKGDSSDSTLNESEDEARCRNDRVLKRRQRFSDELSKTLISIEFPSQYPYRTPIYHSCIGETYHTANTVSSAKSRLSVLFPFSAVGTRAYSDVVAGGSNHDVHSNHRLDGGQCPSPSNASFTNNIAEAVSDGLGVNPNFGSDYSNASAFVTQDTTTVSVGATSSVFNAQNSVIARDSSVANAYHFCSFFPKCIVPYHDPDIKKDNNVYETKVSIISKARSSALLDAVEEPGYRQRKKISEILNRLPVTLEGMNVDDAMLLWQYRRFLTKNPKAFVPFMSSLSWTKQSDVQEAERLIPMWRPVAVEDALVLLSRLFAMSLSLRKYAISILAKESNASLQHILLQLTQAARYDHPPATNPTRSPGDATSYSHDFMAGEVQNFLLDRCITSWPLLSNLYWYVSVESELECSWIINKVVQNREELARNAADAAAITAQRSGKSNKRNQKPINGNLLSKKEMEEPTVAEILSLEPSGTVFTRMKKNIMSRLKVTNILYYRRILKQEMLRKSLILLYTQLNSKKDRTQRIKYAKELINEKCCGLDELFPEITGSPTNGKGLVKFQDEASANNNCVTNQEVGDRNVLFSSPGGLISKLSPQDTTGHPCDTLLDTSLESGFPISSGRGKWLGPALPPPLQEPSSPDDDIFHDKVTDSQILRLLELEKSLVHFPTHPIKAVSGITSDGVYLFKSAKMPIMLPFLEIKDYEDESESILLQFAGHGNTATNPSISQANVSTSSPLSSLPPSAALHNKSAFASAGSRSLPQSINDEFLPFKVIFKSGDDVRQDQLVIQFIELMGNLLKSNGLDLCLTPYRVLATSVNDGYVEVVPDVDTFQNVQRDVQGYLFRAVEEELQLELQALDKTMQTGESVGSLQEDLSQHGTTVVTSALLLEMARKKKAAAMERFIKSCAGYCVITFLLGIGDRHLENLLITKDGRLLHIDFGFIFGNDPKPFPPPMKINKEMVEAIGGVQSEGYAQFKTYCCSAYNILRKHSHLILNLLLLMIDASIQQISSVNGVMPPKFTHAAAKHSNGPYDLFPTVVRGSQQPTVSPVDPRVNLIKIQDKLRLDLNDAEATQYIQNVIADSVGSIFTNLWDVIHLAAQATRN